MLGHTQHGVEMEKINKEIKKRRTAVKHLEEFVTHDSLRAEAATP